MQKFLQFSKTVPPPNSVRLLANADQIDLIPLRPLTEKRLKEIKKSGVNFESLSSLGVYLKDGESAVVDTKITTDGYNYRVTRKGINANGYIELTIDRIDPESGKTVLTARDAIHADSLDRRAPFTLEAVGKNGNLIKVTLSKAGLANPVEIEDGDNVETLVRGGAPTSFWGPWVHVLEAFEQYQTLKAAK